MYSIRLVTDGNASTELWNGMTEEDILVGRDLDAPYDRKDALYTALLAEAKQLWSVSKVARREDQWQIR